jgi:signal transduction histidine kinase
MRRFVADASHELRTPLTSVRGFAELYRQGAAGRTEDVSGYMRRIEDEAVRMGLLVDDPLCPGALATVVSRQTTAATAGPPDGGGPARTAGTIAGSARAEGAGQ